MSQRPACHNGDPGPGAIFRRAREPRHGREELGPLAGVALCKNAEISPKKWANSTLKWIYHCNSSIQVDIFLAFFFGM